MLSFHGKVATAETVSATTMLSLPKRNMDHTKKSQSIAVFSNQAILAHSSIRLTNQLILKRITEKVEKSLI